MKKCLLILAVIFGVNSFGQSFQITPTVSYLFGGRVNYYEGDLKIVDKGAYGLNLAYELGYDAGIEFTWVGSNTTANFNGIGLGYNDLSFKIGVNHFLLGGFKDFGGEKLKGFANFSLGATWFQAKEFDLSDRWNFSVAAGLGLKWFPLRFVGIKLFGRLFLPMEFAGGGAYCGIGTGGASCGVGVNTFAVLVQGDLGGGLIFRIAPGSKK